MTGWQPQQTPAPGGATATQQSKPASLYDVLQVQPNAHPTIIRYAYRFLAGMYHPDNADTGNQELFRIVSDSFRTLSDPGKRAAYDAQIGVKATQGLQPGQVPGFGDKSGNAFGKDLHHIPKTGISYNEVELRLAVLQILLTARKKRAQTGGASAKVLMDVLNIEMSEMEFVLWYLREKGLIARAEANFQITVPGVDYLVDTLAKTQTIDDGGKSDKYSSIQLPATL
jgi:curved DNA-binding protein CbpA